MNGMPSDTLVTDSTPIRITRHIPVNEEEIQAIQRYQVNLEQLFGYYHSLREIIEGHPNIMPLIHALRAENERNLREHGIYQPQKVLKIMPEGIFYQYGQMERGFGVPTFGELVKLANIESNLAKSL